MSWHVTYTASGTTALGTLPVVVDLLQDQASAPVSVLPLPIARQIDVEWSTRDEYGRGLFSMWTDARFIDDGSPLRALLETGDPSKIRLRITVGGKRMIVGVPDVARQKRPAAASGVQAYTVTFTDGVARRAARQWTTGTVSTPKALVQVGLTYALAVIDSAPYLFSHPWAPEWTDSEDVDGPNVSWFDRVRVKASVLLAGSATVGDALNTLLRAFWASALYSFTYERIVVQYVLSGASGAVYSGYDADTSGATVIAPQALDLYVSGEREEERQGQVIVTAEEEAGYAGASASAGTDVSFVDPFEDSMVWTPQYDGDRAIYQFDDPNTSTLAGRVDTGDGTGLEEFETALARTLFGWLGTDRRRLRRADMAGLVDPARVLVTTDTLGDTPKRYRVSRGTWDLRLGITRKVDAFEIP